MQKSLLGPVEYNGCSPDSSSSSGEGDGPITESLCSDSGESGESMPKVYFLAGGGESMCKSEVILGTSIISTVAADLLTEEDVKGLDSL